MARGWIQNKPGSLGLMPWIFRLFCVTALLFASAPGTALPAHAAMPMAGGAAGMSVSHACPPAFMPRAAPASPMAADGCCQGPFACSPCAVAMPALLPPVATLFPSFARAGRGVGPAVQDKLPGQVIPPAAPPPRLLA